MVKSAEIRGHFVICFVATSFALAAAPSWAMDAIGVATAVHPAVAQLTATSTIPVRGGDGVAAYEVLRTDIGGSTKIVFVDGASLSLGASSSVALNSFVRVGPKVFQKATFQLARGSFGFATGRSDKRAYEINTPTATIEANGTAFDVVVTDDRTIVTARSGDVELCPIKYKRRVTKSAPQAPLAGAKCTHVAAGGSGTILAGDPGDPDGSATASAIAGAQPLTPTPLPPRNPLPPLPPLDPAISIGTAYSSAN